MKELKIYKSLLQLDIMELNRFHKFLISPYFNIDERLVKLYEFYNEKRKSKTIASMVTEADVWAANFHGALDGKLLRRLNSDLLSHLATFLGVEELQKHKLMINNLKLKGIGSKNIPELMLSVSRSNKTVLNRYHDNSSLSYYHQYLYEKINFEQKNIDTIKQSKAKLEDEITLDKISDNLDQFYIIEKLKLYIDLLSWQKSFKIDKTIKHIPRLKEILQEQDATNDLITAYLIIIKTLEEPEEIKYFKLLRSIVSRNKNTFSKEDFKYIYNSLISTSVNRMNKGIDEFIVLSFEVYKEALRLNAITQNGNILETTFNNIVAIACRNKEYVWVDDFISEYGKMLPNKTRENALSFSLARVEFYKKNFETVIDMLQTVEYDMGMYNLNSKSILLFSFYEMRELDALDSLLNSFKVYVNRDKTITASRKRAYNKMLNFLKRIANVNPRDKKKIASIKAKLQETKGVLNKAWLLEKIDELK